MTALSQDTWALGLKSLPFANAQCHTDADAAVQAIFAAAATAMLLLLFHLNVKIFKSCEKNIYYHYNISTLHCLKKCKI